MTRVRAVLAVLAFYNALGAAAAVALGDRTGALLFGAGLAGALLTRRCAGWFAAATDAYGDAHGLNIPPASGDNG